MIVYSVILPAYNEEASITRAVTEVENVFRTLGKPFEILVIDDGSTDRTAEIVEELIPRIPSLRLLRLATNRGKGVAVKKGVLEARGEMLLFLDCDLAVHPSEAATMLGVLDEADVVIGSRRASGSVVEVPQPMYRVLLGIGYNQIIRHALGLPYRDTQCGCKAFKRLAARQVFSDMRTGGWVFDAELLLRAQQAGLRIVERPVTWRHGRTSRVRLRDAFQIVHDLFWLRQLRARKTRGTALVAALVATALVLPAFLLPSLSSSYQGIYTSASSDEAYYAAAVREVSEGHLMRRNIYLFEEKEGSVTQVQWIEVPLGILFRVWPGSIGGFILFLKWLGLFAAAGLLFRWIGTIRPDLPSSWHAAAGLGFLVLPAFLGPDLVSRTLDAARGMGSWTEFLNAVRFVNPVISAPLWILSFITLHRLIRHTTLRTAGWHALIVAILGWAYAFFWLFSLAATGITLLFMAAQRRWRAVGMTALALCGACLPVIPLVWSFLSERGGGRADVVTSYTFLQSHSPILEWSVIAAVLVFGVGEWVRRRYAHMPQPSLGTVTTGILAATALLAVNHQVMTGISVQPHHFYFQTNLPIASLLLVLTAGTVSTLLFAKRMVVILGIGAFLVMGWMGVGVQVATIRNVQAEYVDLQRFAPAFQEIRQQGIPFVILADARLSELVPVYTSADVLFAPHAAVHASTSMERRRFAVYLDAWLHNVRTVEDARVLFTSERNRLGLWLFEGQYYRQKCGSYGCFPNEDFETLVAGYSDFLERPPHDHFRRYRINAVLWDERAYPEWQLEQYPFLQKEWSGDQASLWNVVLP